MILPIVLYGSQILKTKCEDITIDYPNLKKLISNMWETVNNANGCGLAAPQVNIPQRIFIVNSKNSFEHMSPEDQKTCFDGDQGIHEVFINAEIIAYSSDRSCEEIEGCLSIPGIAENVKRPWSITIRYDDLDFQEHTTIYSGLTARMIQHEYDHIEGKLYLEYLTPLRKTLLNNKLNQLKNGKFTASYPMRK